MKIPRWSRGRREEQPVPNGGEARGEDEAGHAQWTQGGRRGLMMMIWCDEQQGRDARKSLVANRARARPGGQDSDGEKEEGAGRADGRGRAEQVIVSREMESGDLRFARCPRQQRAAGC